jgi:predicted transcriptional regulator
MRSVIVALPGRWELPNKWPMCARLFAQNDVCVDRAAGIDQER